MILRPATWAYLPEIPHYRTQRGGMLDVRFGWHCCLYELIISHYFFYIYQKILFQTAAAGYVHILYLMNNHSPDSVNF